VRGAARRASLAFEPHGRRAVPTAILSAAAGAATTVAVAAVVASGSAEGAALAVAAVGVGSYQLTIDAQRLLLGADPYTGRRLTDEERYDIAAGLTGGILGSGGAGYGLAALGRLKCPIPAKASPRSSPYFRPPTNSPQAIPTEIQEGWRVRQMPPTTDYPDGYWRLEKPMTNGGWQGINPSTGKPGPQWETHVLLPPKMSK